MHAPYINGKYIMKLDHAVNIKSSVPVGINIPIWQEQLDLPDILDFVEYVKSKGNKLDFKLIENRTPDHIAWNSYNIFNQNIFSMDYIRSLINGCYKNFCREYNIECDPETRINGWINLLKRGDFIPEHIHSSHENSYITGIINFSNYTVETIFKTPITLEEFVITSEPGVITIFPQWIRHRVDATSKSRNTMAFDFFSSKEWNYFNNNQKDGDYPISRSILLKP